MNITDKLDTLEKIMIASNAILFMANRLHSSNAFLKLTPPTTFPTNIAFYEKCRKETDDFLAEISDSMTKITEELGNYCDARDLMCERHDDQILTAAFDALYDRVIKGEDDEAREELDRIMSSDKLNSDE